jgi:uncharacterized protein (TIGR02300 family)
MAKDLGTKFTCFKCGSKFYDMKKPAPVCPKCGADQRDVPPPTRASERKRAAAPVAKLEAIETEDDGLKETEGDEDEEEEEEEDDA